MVEEKREERKEESKSGKEKEKLFVLKENGGHVVLQPERASIFDKRERRREKVYALPYISSKLLQEF